MIKIITEEMLIDLRSQVRCSMSEKRYLHTLGVEREIVRLAEIFSPRDIMMLRAAALLHDLTKEYTDEQQLAILSEHGYDVEYYKMQSRKTYHALTAALCIPDMFPAYSSAELLRSVKLHTTGSEDMTIHDKLLYLADYIEDTRTFEDCVMLRKFFWNGIDSCGDKLLHLDKTLLLSFDMTIKDLIEEKKVIADSTFRARNSLLLSLKEKERI